MTNTPTDIINRAIEALELISSTAILHPKGLFEKKPSRLDAVGTIKENRRLARQALADLRRLKAVAVSARGGAVFKVEE